VKKPDQIKSHPRHNLIRWSVIGIALLVIVVYEGMEWNWQVGSPRNLWTTLDAFVLALLGALAFFSVDRFLRIVEERDVLKADLALSAGQLSEALRRQSTLLRISQMFLDAGDEDEVVELVLHLSRELLGVRGASFVPLDENAQPQSAKSVGEMPVTEASTWLEYLASPGVREACAGCQNHEQLTHSCPLLKDAFQDAMGVYCIPLRRGDQDYGILNLFLPRDVGLDADAQALLKTLMDETMIALESVRMRQHSMAALHQLQILREKTDLHGLLTDLLVSLRDTLEADYVLVSLREGSSKPEKTEIARGVDIPESARHLIAGILQSVTTSREPVLLENAAGGLASVAGVHAIVAAPLVVPEGKVEDPVLGVILAASRRARAFNQRQLSILQMIAGQVSLVVQNVRLVAQLEYKTMIEERMRLAREIHDGLAQTLGFLKLKTAQMRTYLDQGEDELLRDAVDTCYGVLADAYLDARQAIDGLRISSKEGFEGWLQQTVEEFQEYTGMIVELSDPEIAANLPPEVQVQLIRIVQEALSNVRKHAGARRVNINCRLLGDQMVMEVHDDGTGFNVEDVPGPSQHGLRGMRERAELIGADLQVVSQPDKGTTVCLWLPLPEKETLA
jgi:two-component system nitrate/nitrite sensor histidine kinase NarX